MPELPPDPFLSDITKHHPGDEPDTKAIVAWSHRLVNGLQEAFAVVIHTVNALLKVDTLANRTDDPDLNETFFVASNTKQLFAGVSDVWENPGPRRGSITLDEADTTTTATLSPAEPDTSYHVFLSTDYDNGGIWWDAKATTGFEVHVKTAAPAGGATVDWALWRT